MSLDGGLEGLNELTGEVNEVPDTSKLSQILGDTPEVPYNPTGDAENTIDHMESPQDAEKLVAAETAKAGAVIDFTQESLATAEGATGATGLFADEKEKLLQLRTELADTVIEDTTPGKYTPEDKANALKYGHTEYEPSEQVDTIRSTTATENAYDHKVTVQGAEIPGLNETEAEVVQRAAEIMRTKDNKAVPAEELKELINGLESLEERELLGDAYYYMATKLLEQQRLYDSYQRPFPIGEGIDIIASPREKFSVPDPKLSLRDQADLEQGLEHNPRANLEKMVADLKARETIPQPTPGNGPEVVGHAGIPEGQEQSHIPGPEDLLELQGMGLDEFFALDPVTYTNALRRIETTSKEPNNIKTLRAARIVALLDSGKEQYLQDHPDSETVSFQIIQ